MYIHAPEGLGAPPLVPRWKLPPARPSLSFLKIDKFAVNQSALTPALKQAVKHLADSVKASWTTNRPFGIVRLVGHTDSSGTEELNVGLGNRRADAVKQELLMLLQGFRVIVDVDPSPGKSQPTADNRTALGRATNRRVEAFVEPPFIPPDPPPKPRKIDLTPPDPDRDGPWDQFRFKRGIPGLKGKSLDEFLMEKCGGTFSPGTCKTLIDGAFERGCDGLVALLERLGASVSSTQKNEIVKECRALPKRSL